MNDDVPSCGYLQPVAAHYLAQAPPDPIAHYRAAQSFLDAEAVRLGAPAASRLKCALWQNNPPLLFAIGNTQSRCGLFHPQNTHHHFQRLIPNLIVYSTLARRVKKCAKALTSIRSAAPAFRLFIRS